MRRARPPACDSRSIPVVEVIAPAVRNSAALASPVGDQEEDRSGGSVLPAGGRPGRSRSRIARSWNRPGHASAGRRPGPGRRRRRSTGRRTRTAPPAPPGAVAISGRRRIEDEGAGGDQRGGMQIGGDRRGRCHGAGQPEMQRHLRALRQHAGDQADRGRRRSSFPRCRTGPAGRWCRRHAPPEWRRPGTGASCRRFTTKAMRAAARASGRWRS